MNDKAAIFSFLWRTLAPAGAPDPHKEYRFIPSRKFRADFAWPKQKIIVEVDGGQWQAHGGRHAHDADKEKLNLAAENGWRVLRYSPEMLESDPQKVVEQVARTLARKREVGK